MSSRISRICVIVVVLAALAGGGVWMWRARILKRQEAIAGPAMEEAIKAGDFVNARTGLKRITDEGQRAEWEKKIRTGEITHALEVRDADLLEMALGDDGAPWLDAFIRERASLVLARNALHGSRPDTYDKLVAAWKDSSAMPGQWFLLEADRLIGMGKREDALALLSGRKLEGKEEGYRLARLALLQSKDPVAAWKSIEAGLAADPRNSDLLSFQGQLLEAAARPEDARRSYVAALIAEQSNPLHRDTLANFYRRHGRLGEAIDTWREAAETTGLGVYGFKAWFWSRMSGHQSPLTACRQVGWDEVVTALGKVPADSFITADLEAALSRVSRGAVRPETEWLVVLESLARKDAEARLDLTPAARALWPGLAERLRACVTGAAGKDPRIALAGIDKVAPKGTEHEFVRDFGNWSNDSMSPEDKARFEGFLKRPDSAIGALIASGWSGAAVILAGGKHFLPAPSPPEWLVYGYAKSLQEIQGAAAAREWLEKSPSRGAASELLLGELMIATGNGEEGMKIVAKVAKGGSPLAGRAAWTMAMAALAKGDAPATRAAVSADPELAASPRGIELLARAALVENKREEAVELYRKIAADSADALVFLSKEAFAAKRYDEAETLTRQLSERFPEEPQFRRNLLKIQEIRKTPPP